jgi:hypothetical protein
MAKTIYELLARCRKEGECLIFWGKPKSDGYGHLWDTRKKKVRYVHRIAWELASGPIPNGMLVLHRCDNRPCCNPKHLFLGTHADNVRDMLAKKRGPWGEKNANARLTAKQVLEIYHSKERNHILAERYDMRSSTISFIKHGYRWSHVTGHLPKPRNKYGHG